MTLLSTVKRAAILCKVPAPLSVMTSGDRNGLIMAELAQIDAEDLAGRYDWPGLVKEASFTTVAAVAQPGALPDDFSRFASRTDERGEIYDAARREGIAGPASPNQWRELTNGYVGLVSSWRLQGGVLQLAPTPAAGTTLSFTYVSTNLYQDEDGTPKATLEADADTFLIPENVIALGIVWRWKQSKGLDYAEDLRNAETQIEKAIGFSNGGRRMLVVGRSRLRADTYAYPGVLGPGLPQDFTGEF